MRSVKAFVSLLGAGATLVGCHHQETTKQASPHYMTGQAWQGSDSWFYPSERFDMTETGLAIIQSPPKDGVTADGEIWSAQSMTGAHQTLQLPSVVSVRNLANGRIVRVRLNDRGPASSGRLIAVTPRVASLLGMGDEPTPVEISVDEAVSRQIADSNPDAPKLDIAAAPREAIIAQSLDDGSTHTLGLKSGDKTDSSRKLFLPKCLRLSCRVWPNPPSTISNSAVFQAMRQPPRWQRNVARKSHDRQGGQLHFHGWLHSGPSQLCPRRIGH
nr:RlpA-like double-psi beta-barrel domain-containing protein [Asaia prunellae]